MSAYHDFLSEKFRFDQALGFEPGPISPILKPHQRDIVQWAVRKGRAAIFAAFGLGKTLAQLEIARHVHAHEGGRQLIILPLGVRQEFRHDAAMLGMETTFVRRSDEVTGDGLYLTNYESVRDGKLDVNLFNCASLDEASVLRSYGSKTYQEFLALFGSLKYRFVATATPSPNRYKELIHYAGFLGVMDTGQALTRFFQRDSTKANNLTLYPHKVNEFFVWLHSWALFLQQPSDLGYSDDGYDLPPLNVAYHEVRATALGGTFEPNGQGQLIRDAALGLKEAAAEKRDSIPARVSKVMELVHSEPVDQIVIWCDLNDEQAAIEAALKAAGISVTSLYGNQDADVREAEIMQWKDRATRVFLSKPTMYGSGVNLQQCHTMIFAGIGYKFNDFWQACHRVYRYLQTSAVAIHIIYTETEREILKVLQTKWAEDESLRVRMSEIIREHGLSTTGLESELRRTIGVQRKEVVGARYLLAHNDCVAECDEIADDSIDLIHTSIPFGNHYEYCASYNDFGHNDDNERFFEQMDFLTPKLLRILKPGRVAAIHVKDRIRFGNVTGYGMPSVDPFHADCIAHYRRHGFVYFGMITVVTDVVRENNQTYRLGWTENSKDGTKMGVGSPEYVLLFRKLPTDTSKGYADERVAKAKTDYSRARWQVDAHAFWRSSGDRLVTVEEMCGFGPDKLAKVFTDSSLRSIYNYSEHVQIGEALEARGALPATFMAIAPGSHHPEVWTDVNRMLTLNGEQARRNVEMHVCPLQFDIVDRIIERYTNKDDLVFDPFGGIGTVPMRAVMLGRRGRSAELNEAYWHDAVRYLRQAEREATMPTLFDFADIDKEQAV